MERGTDRTVVCTGMYVCTAQGCSAVASERKGRGDEQPVGGDEEKGDTDRQKWGKRDEQSGLVMNGKKMRMTKKRESTLCSVCEGEEEERKWRKRIGRGGVIRVVVCYYLSPVSSLMAAHHRSLSSELSVSSSSARALLLNVMHCAGFLLPGHTPAPHHRTAHTAAQHAGKQKAGGSASKSEAMRCWKEVKP